MQQTLNVVLAAWLTVLTLWLSSLDLRHAGLRELVYTNTQALVHVLGYLSADQPDQGPDQPGDGERTPL